MCIKSVYYTTHGDGSQDVTEFVDTCKYGEMCSHPEIREYNRKPSTYHSDQHLRLPPTPRQSKSPSPNRKHKSAVYINNEKVADIPSGKKRHSHLPARSDRERVILHAPEPPAPPRLSRSSTMPAEYVTPERSSRPRHRPTTYYRRHVAGPEEFVYVDDAREQRERRRGRRSSTTHERSSDFASSSTAGASDAVWTAHHAPAVHAAGKKLRWEDQLEAEIVAQNERISARPALHQELKSILKHRKGKDADVYEDLRRAVDRMDIAAGGKDRSPRRPESGEYEYDRDRLRARFGDDPKDRRRRSRVSYGTGLYDYQ